MNDHAGVDDAPGLGDTELMYLGAIVYRCGALEYDMKQLPITLLAVRGMGAQALTAHLSFASIADMSEAILTESELPQLLKDDVKKAVIQARAAYDERSALVHGPILDTPDGIITVGFSARRKLQFRSIEISTDGLLGTLKRVDDACWAIDALFPRLREAHRQLDADRPSAQSHNSGETAKNQTP